MRMQRMIVLSLVSILVLSISTNMQYSNIANAAVAVNPFPMNDPDLDGIPNFPKGLDNCPNKSNANQLDSDKDRIGDACDPSPVPQAGQQPGTPPTAGTIEESSKPSFTKRVMPNLGTLAISGPYKVKVTFNSVTVHNSHEGALSGDGEYDLSVYVHGKLVSLTDLSKKAGGDGLWDVSSGETVNFPAGSEIVVDIDKSLPLSIFTVGSEVDGCDRTSFPANIQGKIVSLLEKGVNYLIPLGSIQDELNKAINWVGCKLNPNDSIGNIKQVYDPVGYGAGPHTDKSDKGDFTMRYTISVAPPTPPVASSAIN